MDTHSATMAERVRALRATLAETGEDFLLLANDGAAARLRFIGPFEGAEVVWDATVHALRARAGAAAPYLDIGTETPYGHALTVGLDLAHLDTPALRKTVIMVRQYRRLRRGHIAFGEAP